MINDGFWSHHYILQDSSSLPFLSEQVPALAPCSGLPDRHVGKVEDQGGRERHGELLGDLAEETSPLQNLKMNQQQLGLYILYLSIYIYIYTQYIYI